MDKIRVIIAEDEPPISRFIRYLTEQDKDFEVICICESAEEAISAVEILKPGLLITDIRLPGMTGLELIHRIREKDRQTRIVIISGYKMFEYAKEAIRLGIEDYLTKPVDPLEFSQVLEGVRQFYRQESAIEIRGLLEKAIFNQDAVGFSSILELKEISLLIVYHSTDSIYKTFTGKLQEEGMHSFVYKNSTVCFRSSEEAAQIKAGRTPVLKRLLDLEGGRTFAGIYIERIVWNEEVPGKIRRLYQTLRKLAIPGKCVKVNFKEMSNIEPEDKCHDGEAVDRLRIQIRANASTVPLAEWKNLLELWKKQEASVYHMKTVLHSLAEQFRQSRHLKNGTLKINEFMDDCIRYAGSYEEIGEQLLQFMEEIVQEEGGRERENARDGKLLFESILEFLKGKENTSYSLYEISELYGVSQPYIRKVFKQYTGVSYNEYVLRDKIRQAEELMKENPHILVKDVAEAIGFEQLYFSTVFSKYKGVTPSQYKHVLERLKENKIQEKEAPAAAHTIRCTPGETCQIPF